MLGSKSRLVLDWTLVVLVVAFYGLREKERKKRSMGRSREVQRGSFRRVE